MICLPVDYKNRLKIYNVMNIIYNNHVIEPEEKEIEP